MKASKKKALKQLMNELTSDEVKSGHAENQREHAMFVRALQLDEARKPMIYQ